MFLPQQDGALHIFAALLFQPGKRHFPPSHPLPHPGSSRASDAVLSAPASGRYVPDHLSFVRTSHALGPFGYVLAPSETGSIALRPCHIFIPAWQASFPVPAAAQLQRNKQSHSVTLPPPWFGRASAVFRPLLRTGSSEVRQCCFKRSHLKQARAKIPFCALPGPPPFLQDIYPTPHCNTGKRHFQQARKREAKAFHSSRRTRWE